MSTRTTQSSGKYLNYAQGFFGGAKGRAGVEALPDTAPQPSCHGLCQLETFPSSPTVLQEDFGHSGSQDSRNAPREGHSWTQMWCAGTPQLLSPKCHCLPPTAPGPWATVPVPLPCVSISSEVWETYFPPSLVANVFMMPSSTKI